MNRVDFARNWNSLSTGLKVWLTACLLLLATASAFGVYRTLVPSDPPPSCVQAELNGRPDNWATQADCEIQAEEWCSRHVSDVDHGLCMDKLYGTVPSDYNGSGDPLDAPSN